MSATITVNGTTRGVRNALRSGPSDPISTYELTGGDYVFRCGAHWFLQVRGQSKVEVVVGGVS